MTDHDGFVTTGDGVRLFYQAAGTGPGTVIVPNGTYLRDDLAALTRSRRIVFFDLRNRGRSDAVESPDRLGILQDVEDAASVARHFSDAPVDVIGHSFAGLLAVLYARAYPGDVRRVVQIGPMAADPDRQFPPSLTNHDATFVRVMADLGSVLQARAMGDEVALCEKVWSVLAALYVTSEADAGRIKWGRCSLPNERHGMRYFNEQTLPSIRRLALTASDVRGVAAPVLIVHGRQDRSAPYGAGREWAMALPNARLVTVEQGAHAPWIEAPDLVLGSIDTFLGGHWPAAAERVEMLLPETGRL